MQKTLKKIREKWLGLALHNKTTILMVIFLIIPSIFFVSIFFSQVEDNEKQSIISQTQFDLQTILITAEENRNAALTILQTVSSHAQIDDLLGDEYNEKNILESYSELKIDFGRITSVNPNIRNLRIYVDSAKMPESFPLFINNSRVKDEEWYQNSNEKYSVRVGYKETFSDFLSPINLSLVSINQEFNFLNEEKSIAEVSFTMEEFFGEVYTKNNGDVIMISFEGEVFTNADLNPEKMSLYTKLIKSTDINSNDFTEKIISGTEYLISNYKSDTLGISYYIITNLTESFSSLRNMQFLLSAIILISVLIITVIFSKLSKVMFRKIYETMDIMHSHDFGDISKFETDSSDELGQFKEYFNRLIDKINYFVAEESRRAVIEKEMEIKALQTQINAHFLYNVLNNIEMMAIIDSNYQIADTVTALSKLLRYSMNWKSQMVTIKSEVDYIIEYTKLFNIRFDNEINLILDISDEVYSSIIPKMTIQPIVENSIKYGFENSTEDLLLRITGEVIDGDIVIGVTDTGIGMEEQTLIKVLEEIKDTNITQKVTGIGLQNVQERITMKYGKNYGLDIQSKHNSYTKVTIKLPFSSASEISSSDMEANREKHIDS